MLYPKEMAPETKATAWASREKRTKENPNQSMRKQGFFYIILKWDLVSRCHECTFVFTIKKRKKKESTHSYYLVQFLTTVILLFGDLDYMMQIGMLSHQICAGNIKVLLFES